MPGWRLFVVLIRIALYQRKRKILRTAVATDKKLMVPEPAATRLSLALYRLSWTVAKCIGEAGYRSPCPVPLAC